MELISDRQVTMNRSVKGMFMAVSLNNGCLFNIFLTRKLIIKNPINILYGAGATDIKKGIRITDQ
jgi:hypothetical protein